MDAKVNMPLWAFWDIYGNTTKVRLIGGSTEPNVNGNDTSLPSTSRDDQLQLIIQKQSTGKIDLKQS